MSCRIRPIVVSLGFILLFILLLSSCARATPTPTPAPTPTPTATPRPLATPTLTPIPTTTPTVSYAGKRILIYSFGGTSDQGLSESACKNLKLKYGAECSLIPGSSVGNVSKAIAEKADPQVDLLRTEDAMVDQAKANGIAVKIDFTRIPNSKDLFKGTLTYGDYFVPHATIPITISYRTDKVPKKITKWADLWDPDFKGKITTVDFSSTAAYQFLEATAKIAGDRGNLDAGFEKLKQLKPNICKIATATVVLSNLLTTGECPIGVMTSTRSYPLIDMGLPVEVVSPEDYPVVQVAGMILLREKNKDLAYLFINELLDPRVQAELAVFLLYGPTTSKASDYMSVQTRIRTPDTQEEFSKLTFSDWELLNKRRQEFMERFSKEIVK